MHHHKLPMGRCEGCLPRTTPLGKHFPVFGEVHETYHRDDWPELLKLGASLDGHVKHVKDQGNEGSCAGNSSAWTLEVLRSVAGLPFVELSAMSLYKRTGRSANSGSTLDDNLRELVSRGVLPVSGTPGYEHTHPSTGFSRPLPDGWEKTAALFKLDEHLADIRDFTDFISALLCGFPISGGVLWNRGGHALMFTKAIQKDDGTFGAGFWNPWGEHWGDGGRGEMWEGQISEGITRYGMWAARTPTMTETAAMI